MATGIWETGTCGQHRHACSVSCGLVAAVARPGQVLTCGQCQRHWRDVLGMSAVQVEGIGVRQQHAPGHVATSREEGHVQQRALIWVPQNVAQHGAALQMVESLQGRTVGSAQLPVGAGTGVLQSRHSLHSQTGS